ncbi:MAG: hypothetical protein RIS70_1640, partial [Planctomycetota bacterium]
MKKYPTHSALAHRLFSTTSAGQSETRRSRAVGARSRKRFLAAASSRGSRRLHMESLEQRINLSHLGDPAILGGFTVDPALSQIQSQPPGETTGATPSG